MCAFSKRRTLLLHAHSPGKLLGPPATQLGPGVQVRRAQVLQTAEGALGHTLPGRHPLGPPPPRAQNFLLRSHRGRYWRDSGRTEDPEAGFSPPWQRVTYWWECQPQKGCQGSGPLGGGSQAQGSAWQGQRQQDPSQASSGQGQAGGHLLGPFRGRDCFPHTEPLGIPCRS